MIDYTSAANILSVKRRAMLPTSQQLYGDVEIVKILTEELHADIAPMLMSVREDYMLHYFDQAINTGVNVYEIPTRAIGTKLKDAVLLNSNGFEISIQRLEPGQIKHQWWTGQTGMYNRRVGFFFEDDQIRLFPDTQNLDTYTLRMKYFRRPNNVIQTTEAAQITNVNGSALTVDKIPATLYSIANAWSTSLLFDIIKGTPSFRSRGDDLAITQLDINAKQLTFSAIPSGVVVGDWVSIAGTSPIAQIPYEVHNLLDQRASVKILEGMGDPLVATAAGVYKDMVDKFKVMVAPRADDSPKRVVRNSQLFGDRNRRGNW